MPTAVFTANPNVAISDDGYTGAGGTGDMTCSTINTTQFVPPGTIVANLSLNVAATHTWVGDLKMKLRSPSGTTLTFLNRHGSGAFGNSANWNNVVLQLRNGAGPEAETMGNGLTTDQRVCTDTGVCKYDPSPDTAVSPASFAAAFNGSAVAGNWTLCVGDSAPGDVGTLNSWTLKFVSPSPFVPTAALVSVGGQISSADGMPVRRALVTLIDSNGQARTARTNPFGFYRFADVAVGESYTAAVEAKGYTFTPQVVYVADELQGLNFTALP